MEMIFSHNDKNEKGNIMFTTSYKYRLSVVAALLIASTLSAAQVGTLTNFEANTTAKASEVNHNFIVLKDAVNDNDTRISAKQDRVSGACGAGFYMQSVNADGSVVCQQDMDTNTVYTDGIGLSLTGTTFNVDTTAIQSRVTSSCAAGSSIRAIYADGTVTCELDTDTNSGGDITRVIASSGLTGGGYSGDVTVKRASGSVSVNNRSLMPNLNYNDNCDLYNGTYYSAFNNSSNYPYCRASMSVSLPDKSTITSVTCRLYSNDTTTDEVPSIFLYGMYLTSNSNFTMSSLSAGADSDEIQTITDTTINSDYIDNSRYSYAIQFRPTDTRVVGLNNRFYNCTINYTY